MTKKVKARKLKIRRTGKDTKPRTREALRHMLENVLLLLLLLCVETLFGAASCVPGTNGGDLLWLTFEYCKGYGRKNST